MSGSVIADFVAHAVFDDAPRREPVRARVLLGEDRIVVASRDDEKRTIPLSAIYDASVSQVPRELEGFVDQSVRVGYREGDRGRTVVLQGSHDSIDKFAVRLYRQLLGGASAQVRHPAKRGGRLTGGEFRTVTVLPGESAATIRGRDGAVELDLDAITDVRRVQRGVDDATREVVSVRHWDGQRALTTELTYDEARLRTVLSRYLRLRVQDAQETVADASIDDDAERALVAMYADAAPEDWPAILDVEPDALAELLARLERSGLVADADGGTLTDAGRLLVANRYADARA